MGIHERKEREKERRRQQIMVAAKRVFSGSGFSKSTMEDIAREAELSPGTIYLYFKNKDELYASLSVRILHYLSIRLKHVIENKDLQPEQYIDALKQAMLDVYDFDPLIVINLFQLQSSETLKNLTPELLE
jgi:AcrR family transcriptional regulator